MVGCPAETPDFCAHQTGLPWQDTVVHRVLCRTEVKLRPLPSTLLCLAQTLPGTALVVTLAGAYSSRSAYWGTKWEAWSCPELAAPGLLPLLFGFLALGCLFCFFLFPQLSY